MKLPTTTATSDKQFSSQPKHISFPFVGIKTVACVTLLALSSVSIIQNVYVSSTHQTRNEDEEISTSQQIIQDKNAQQRIAWMMTFPNSGTTYTSSLVKTVTGTYTATNYGQEKYVQGGRSESQMQNRKSVSVLTDNPIPSWSVYNGNGLELMGKAMKPPTKGYVLTKTHCGGYCFECFVGSQSKDTQDTQAFFKECGKGQYVTQNITSGKFHAIEGYTPREKIARAVHVIRDPFDNVVARFHYHREKTKEQAGSEPWLANYPNTRDGFRNFCNDLGAKWRAKEKRSVIYKGNMFELVKDVPCHSDFFRYIQWHNMAFATTADLGIPSMVIYYENYAENFNKTKDDLLQFLQQDEVNDPPIFLNGKTYRHYYTKEEIGAVSTMFSKLGHQETRNKTKHYFEDYM
eukprot:CAMPEP_0172563944 /NCGR_PEP_ID=MMETSP1067-20121228/102417_1 /TAXON_ID=265564 ORGANISM="Thalassiosira punctigera, Strain Tpunct2005C2" /NCGR_SAMPLE_ID=MMETSP1067 /ASSEMBLY_ACC=CAM_ASM_000444 /LENGTH=403 /DNA_ID=CAMNT_0013354493 /DNA_START=264 /DNA_END=1475 /DNA_ORIENTATION=-